MTTFMLAEFDAETRFQVRAARGAGTSVAGCAYREHPEVGIDDGAQIPLMTREGEVWAGPPDRPFVLLKVSQQKIPRRVEGRSLGK